jgi:hypothetical protein
MRFITTDPEFSWQGTLIIVVGFGAVFLGQAGAYLGRRSGARPSSMVMLRVLATRTQSKVRSRTAGPGPLDGRIDPTYDVR